jgi:phosphoglucosamine mutase
MSIRFGTDGIRGRVGESPITGEVAAAVGAAAVGLARRYGGSRVLICRDTRPSGAGLASAIASGVAEVGGVALDAEVLATPGAAYALEAGLADVAVVVTASHNVASDNGFKVLSHGGHKLQDDETLLMESFLASPPDRRGQGQQWSIAGEARRAYDDALELAIGTVGERLAGRRIVVDLAHGAAVKSIEFLKTLPVDWVFVGAGEGVINQGCGSEHLEHLSAAVTGAGAFAGLAVDGDGDRCRLVDHHGRVVAGDAVTWLLTRGARATGLAVTVMSNGALEACLPGVRVVRTPVGDRHLRAAMDTHGLSLGAEESGHILFADQVAGDGLVAGLRTLALAGGDLAAAVEGYRPLPRGLTKVRVSRRPALDQVPQIQEVIRARTAELGPGGRVFCRYSGTEPVLRILVEGQDPETTQRVLDEVTAAAEVLA